jgi:hypothetical protein
MITGMTVEKKLIGIDCAMYRLNSTGNLNQFFSLTV